MRMEEFSDSKYIKSTDQIERYLLKLIEQYCNSSNISSPASREYIIKRAVQRMKEEITFDNMGVLSITLEDGVKRTGAVSITLNDLNGEPLISHKMSAFNVPFGVDENTACEGNDPRLSDKRTPIAHSHSISDIIGLEGQLSTLEGIIARDSQFNHEHSNQNILDMLVYTGDKNTIDLGSLESLDNKIQNLVDKVIQEISDGKQEIDNKISSINTLIDDVKQQINDLKQLITDKNKEYYKKSTDYTDDKITEVETLLTGKINNLITKDMLNSIIDTANKTYTFVGQSTHTVQSIIANNTQTIDSSILNEISNRGTSFEKCIFDISLKYISSSGEIFMYSLPYIYFNNNTINGIIQAELLKDGTIIFNVNIDNIPDYIYQGDIVIDVYSTSIVSI